MGQRATYDCVDGYTVIGGAPGATRARIRCVGDDTAADWDNPRPSCERKFDIYSSNVVKIYQ